jgi:hypothetical protein
MKMQTKVVVTLMGAFLSTAAYGQGLSASDHRFLQELGYGETDTLPLFKEMSATQNQCVHFLINRPATEAKRKKDLQDYLGVLGTRWIFKSTKGPVSEATTPCPK